MKNVKRKIGKLATKLIVIVFVMSSLQVTAAGNSNEFAIHGGGGYSFFLFRPSVTGASSSGASGDLGVGFTGFVAPYVGLHVGVGLGIYSINVKVDSIKAFTSNLIDIQNLNFDLYSTLSGYSEAHQTFCLSVPLMLQYQTMPSQSSWGRSSGSQQGFYAMGGLKLNILLSNSYESSIKTLRNEAYYPDFNNWAATQNFAGLGNFKGRKAKGNVGYVQAMLALEAGMKWRISNEMFIYTGAYFD